MIVHFICSGSDSRLVIGFHEDPSAARSYNRFSHAGIVHPVGDATDVFGEKDGASVDELGEFVDFVEHSGVLQVGDPLGWFGVGSAEFEFDFEDGVGKSRDFVGFEWFFGVAEPFGASFGVVASFGDHAEVGVEADA